MNTTIGAAQTTVQLASNASSSAQNYYFTRFVSPPLDAQTVSANTWTYNFAARESSTSANFPCTGNNKTIYISCYLWRPGTGKVAAILEGSSTGNNSEQGANISCFPTSFSGSQVTAQAKDVICLEVWFQITQGSATSYTDNYYFDGTTVNTTQGAIVTNHASFLETPQNLTILTTPTRFYLHAASSGVGGTLPTTKQSTQTMTANFDAYTVNRIMDLTKASGTQTDITATKTAGGASTIFYMSRFVSDPLNESSIPAQTWTLNFASWASSTSMYYPCNSSGYIPSCLYVWRPSDGTKVGTIFDGLSAVTSAQIGHTTEYVSSVTFTGSAVANLQSGDVLCFEAMTASSTTSSWTYHYAFDGATINLVDNTAASNHAAFIETPEAVIFYTVSPPIDMTPNKVTITNKFITKV